jgi:hypothetical protein
MDVPTFGLIAACFAYLGYINTQISSIERRTDALSRLEAKLDLLIKSAGLNYGAYPGLPTPVAEALREGKKIEAIKRYREATGVNLKMAKEFIEEAQRRSPLGA